MNKEQILENIKEFILEKNQKKTWVAGKDWVRYAGPLFDEEEYLSAISSLLDGWLVLGKDAIQFEKKFPQFLGKDYGVLTNSGSSANLVMMSAMKSKRSFGFPEGTKVITPIAGFPTTINPIFQVGFTPIFVDIELETLNLNLDSVEEEAKKGAKIITFAHVLGNPPDLNRLNEIVTKYDLILLEDCCDALDSFYDNKPLGSFGEMSTCSFYPAHHITMGEGGFVATKTFEQEIVVRSFREWGRGCFCVGEKANLLKNGSCGKRFSEWIPDMPGEIFDHKYIYNEIGFNLKPIELQASIGLKQLEKIKSFTAKRKNNHQKLNNIFKKYDEFFVLPQATKNSDPSWFAFAMTVKKNKYFGRNDIVKHLEDNKIQTRPYFAGNILLQPAYRDIMDRNSLFENFPISTTVTKDTFFLGTSPVISEEQISYIEKTIDNFFKKIKSCDCQKD